MAYRISTFLRSFSSPSVARPGSPDDKSRQRPDGGTSAHELWGSNILQSVNTLLAGEAFDPEAVYHRYWIGDYDDRDAGTSLFGTLQAGALEKAIAQVMKVGQRELKAKPSDKKHFIDLFQPLLDAASVAVAQSSGGHTASPSMPAPLSIKRIVNALYNNEHQNNVAKALEWFGGRIGEALWTALDLVEDAIMEDPELTIGENDRKRLRADIASVRQLVLMAEADALLDGGVSPHPLARPPSNAGTGCFQPRHVVHALLDHPPGADVSGLWALFGERQGLALLTALDEVEQALYDPVLKDLIGDRDRQKISACIEQMRQSVHVDEKDLPTAEVLRAKTPSSSVPPEPWDVINRLLKGKHVEDDSTAMIELFGGCTGDALWSALDGVEAALHEDARSGQHARVPTEQREEVLACLESFRQRLTRESQASDATIDALIAEVEQMLGSADASQESAPHMEPPGPALDVLDRLIVEIEARKRQPRQLVRRRPLADVRIDAFRRTLELGGVKAMPRLLAHLAPQQQWHVMATLVEDPVLQGRYPDLLALEAMVYRSYVARQRGDQPLERVRNWYRLLSAQSRVPSAPPAVPAGFEPQEWIHLLWITLYRRYPERSGQRDELGRALDRYQKALGVKTDREHGEALWLDSVSAALKVSVCGHSLLEALRERLGKDSNVGLALTAALAELRTFDENQQGLLYRAAAILIATHNHSLPCIAVPYGKTQVPQQLNIFYPRKPKLSDPPATWDRYRELVDKWTVEEPLVAGDQRKVREWLSAPPSTKSAPDGQGTVALTAGEQCDRLLCAMELPPKRVELALLVIVQSCKDPDDREMYLLARRLLSELLYSERNYGGRNKPMSARDIVWRMLGVVANGLREGGAHGLALFGARVAAYYVGPWAVPVMGVVSGGLSLWAWHHLEQAKSPDYRLNPSPLLDNLIRLVPSLNTVALSSLFLCTGILPVTHGINVPLDIGEALYLMNIMRLLRQLMQSGTQPLARLFRLTDRRGAGLSSQVAFYVNCGRDAAYLVSTVSFLIYFADYLNGLVAQWGPPGSAAEVMRYLGMVSTSSALNEAADGMNPDITILSARFVSWLKGALGLGEDDLMLQPGVPMQWADVPRHMQDHIAGRITMVGLMDSVLAAAALAVHLKQPGLALFFRWMATLLNAFMGALRGRELTYMRTTDPRASAVAVHDGFTPPRNPDGLLVAMGYAASGVLSQARQAARWLGLVAGSHQMGVVLPPQAREVMRGRANTLVQSSRGRSAAPDSRPEEEDAPDADEEGSQQLVGLSGGTPVERTPVMKRMPRPDDDSEYSGPLVDLSDGTPRLQRTPIDPPPDDFSER